jgi:nucleoid-associated protein YgaU
MQGRNAVTREHKLALIVGFSLVLVLTVLVSDHFSKARQVEMDEKVGIATASQVGAMPAGLRLNAGPTITIDQPPSPLGETGALAAAPQHALPGTNPAPAPAPSPRGGISDPTINPAPQGPAGQGTPTEITQLPAQTQPSGPGLTGGVRPVVPQTTIGQTMTPIGGAGPGPGVGPSPKSETAAAAPAFPMKRHDVHEGDSIFGIARQYYGDGKLWEKVREYNKDRVGPKGELREGVTLLLPPKEVLLGKPYTGPAAPATAPTDAAKPGAKPSSDPTKPVKPDTRVVDAGGAGGAGATPLVKEYTIQSGDTLASVAKKTLGSSKRWPELVDANKGLDPESLSVGAKIRIPADAKR